MQLYSAETFEFLGYAPEFAEKLLQRGIKRFKSWLMLHMASSMSRKNSWRMPVFVMGSLTRTATCMLPTLELLKSLTIAMLHKEFEDIRYTATYDS